MKERNERLQSIKKIIRDHRITSQDELLDHLHGMGFKITQATLSRDLKLLQVGKIARGGDGYHYTLPSEEELRESETNFNKDLQRGYVSLEFSSNIGVMRTLTGHADSVAIALDNLFTRYVIGTIAGDDTVIIVLRSESDAVLLQNKLRESIPGIED
ncbi:MAG: ArgR family transcriptional regulator [Spirochaeta sp.]|nr:ArgR family transcriptional regulator [Spirochaeta sp.]